MLECSAAGRVLRREVNDVRRVSKRGREANGAGSHEVRWREQGEDIVVGELLPNGAKVLNGRL